MSENYQVLARKYRPHSFGELVGQTHAKKTLINALDNNTLHHGFLFTGTRGVGKTTIARIFAKSINCEAGVSSTPCGKCPTCIEIDQGQSVDLIELDAASHTGVDNMRDILENAQYMPTKNRYKIYLIDEVHMLSKSSFNALLKTLEEPPEHVKFLLATTDPQKLPITVLSRCLQFSLNKLTHAEILGQLKFIMETEGLSYEESALSQIADFGNGSMRDALSLLDQSISYGNGTVTNDDIKAMLGLVHHDDIITLAIHLFNQDAKAVIEFIKELSHRGENLGRALKDLASLFHQLSVVQVVGSEAEDAQIKDLAAAISNQDLQIFYQMAINGSKDMSLAPSDEIGFEMTLLRMLAFHSDEIATAEKKTLKIKPKADKAKASTKVNTPQNSEPEPEPEPEPSNVKLNSQTQWEDLIQRLSFNGAGNMLIKNTLFDHYQQGVLTLTLDQQFANLLTDLAQQALEKTLIAELGISQLSINLGTPNTQTLAQKQNQAEEQRIQAMQEKFLANPGLQQLEKNLNARVDVNSIAMINQEKQHV